MDTWEALDSDDDWERAADEGKIVLPGASEGVKASWEDEDEDEVEEQELKKHNTGAPNPAKKKNPTKKKPLTKKEQKQIEEHKRKLELLANSREEEDERERLRELELAADYEHAQDLFGDESVSAEAQAAAAESRTTVLTFEPRTAADYKRYAQMFGELFDKHAENRHYPVFVKELARVASQKLVSEDVKDVVKTLNSIATDKIKLESGKKKKKKGPKTTRNAAMDDDMVHDKYDEFDAFM